MLGRLVVDGMDGVKPQCVNVEFADPAQGISNEVAPHFTAVRPVEVDRLAPGGRVLARKVRAKVGQVVSFRPQMVVNHIEHNRQTAVVALVNKSFQSGRPAIAVLHRKRIYAIVSPISSAGKRRHRHQLNRGYSKFHQVIELVCDSIECTEGGESSHVQLVDNVLCNRPSAPFRIAPVEVRSDDLRRAVDAGWLQARRRIGSLNLRVESI